MLRLLAEAMRHSSLFIQVMTGEDRIIKFILHEEKAEWIFTTVSGLEFTINYFSIEVTDLDDGGHLKVLILR